ncbi:hypothetical protein GCM10017786_57350 [Amycolatopsis deserti]|uniref:Uncharacterized protein n=1 Tax=Amycolatopsis deserti TaxID=185696 RepID=A0ABQ3JBB6_9PSEU|nr:hypothetical protein GCM10017786_57350 [Amycolatopsis deserti]
MRGKAKRVRAEARRVRGKAKRVRAEARRGRVEGRARGSAKPPCLAHPRSPSAWRTGFLGPRRVRQLGEARGGARA